MILGKWLPRSPDVVAHRFGHSTHSTHDLRKLNGAECRRVGNLIPERKAYGVNGGEQ
jgi:hypothetical protein